MNLHLGASEPRGRRATYDGVPAIWTQHSIVRPPFVLSDICALCTTTGATLLLCVWTVRVGTDLRLESAFGRTSEID